MNWIEEILANGYTLPVEETRHSLKVVLDKFAHEATSILVSSLDEGDIEDVLVIILSLTIEIKSAAQDRHGNVDRASHLPELI